MCRFHISYNLFPKRSDDLLEFGLVAVEKKQMNEKHLGLLGNYL